MMARKTRRRNAQMMAKMKKMPSEMICTRNPTMSCEQPQRWGGSAESRAELKGG